ncbi:unnamed protein product [Allacma fusca]|uniref:Uncharacterized protein n=1 Tax=Allacma fusca TaxID=39272 RepID=A0A8J2LBJ3_9HEXA|nr:unnamed protein product [Allacma fusca]
MAEDDDNRKSAFRLDFMIPEPDSVILIDKIWGEDKASTPTTIRPTTPKRFANSTTRDPAELTTTPSWAFRISSPSHFTFSGAILLTLGFFLY